MVARRSSSCPDGGLRRSHFRAIGAGGGERGPAAQHAERQSAAVDPLTSFYQSFAHLTNASQLGFTDNLAGSITAMLAKIQVYKPTGSDFAATQMNNAALASAGQMAAAQQLYSSSTQRIQ